jgi:hypothetical protein
MTRVLVGRPQSPWRPVIRRLVALVVLAAMCPACAAYYQTVYRATGRCSSDRGFRETMRSIFGGNEPSPGAYCPSAFPAEEPTK